MMRVTIFLIAVFSGFSLNAQQFGGHPPSQKWLQINTDSIRLIFPPGLERQAADIVDITRALGRTTLPTIGNRTHKISIVLQNQTTNSNGYVGLGPWRSEFYLTPMQNSFALGSLPWHKSLALHEYRHVQQFNNFNKGVSRVAYTIFGEQILSVFNSAAVPNYFWEGDAVYQETLMSGQGRGRLPYFQNGYRSLWSAQKNYSWQKLRNGSLRDYVPDHYQLGYLLVAYGRMKYGDSVWANITDDAVRFQGLFYPWQKAIERHLGLSYPQFRQAALKYFERTLTGKQDLQKKDSLSRFAGSRKHFAGDEYYPQWISGDEVVFVKSDYKNIPAFAVRNILTGSSKKIRIKNISDDEYFSYKNGRITYSSYLPDLRWGWKDYSSLQVVDIKTGAQKTITRRNRYFSPDISQDGSELVAVHVDPSGTSALHIIKSAESSSIQVLPNLSGLFFSHPKFAGDERSIIVAARNESGRMALVRVNRNDGVVETLTPWSWQVIDFPLVQNDTITFTASNAGVDRLFMLVGKRLFVLNTGSATGVAGNYQGSIYGNNVCWSAFSAVGYRMQFGHFAGVGPFPEISMKEISMSRLADTLPDFGAITKDDGGVTTGINSDQRAKPDAGSAGADFLNQLSSSSSSSSSSYRISKYRKSYNLLNPHSLRPYFNEPDFTVSLLGENVLNTFVSELYFNYNSNEKSKTPGANLTYGGLFAWIRGGVNYTFDRSTRVNGNRVYWNEAEANLGLSVPLNLTRGRFYRRLTAGSDYVINARNFKGAYKDSFDNRSFGYLRSSLTFSNQLLQAKQHIYPRFAQTLTLNYSQSVSSLEANQFMASAYWYFPGILMTHNIVVNTAFQGRDTLRNATFSNSFPFSRGYIAENYHHMFKLGANYHLPLVYPDWGFASIVYFQRIRANLFFDFTRINDFNRQGRFVAGNFRSVGTEIFFDTKWWNQQPATFGIRYSRLLDAENQGISPNQWGFILPLELIN
jgi:hypothetical protein